MTRKTANDALADCWNDMADQLEAARVEIEHKQTYIDFLRDSLALIAQIDLDEPNMGLRDCVHHAQGSLVPDMDEVVHHAAQEKNETTKENDSA
jgi:hypothetical protein